ISASHSNLWVRRTRRSPCPSCLFIDTPAAYVAYPTARLLLLLDPCCILYHTRDGYRSKDIQRSVDERLCVASAPDQSAALRHRSSVHVTSAHSSEKGQGLAD